MERITLIIEEEKALSLEQAYVTQYPETIPDMMVDPPMNYVTSFWYLIKNSKLFYPENLTIMLLSSLILSLNIGLLSNREKM